MAFAELEAEWLLALDDAGLAPAQVRLFLFEGPEPADHRAVWFRPRQRLVVDDEFPDASRLQLANNPEVARLHRVAFWPAISDPPVIGALLRHELEHARQWDSAGAEVFAIYDLLRSVLGHKAGGLTGCAGLFGHSIPAEQDANAAAAMFIRRHHSDEVARLCADPSERALACSLVGPDAYETLWKRMVCWAYLFREDCEAVLTNPSTSVAGCLEVACSGAGELWSLLEAACLRPG